MLRCYIWQGRVSAELSLHPGLLQPFNVSASVITFEAIFKPSPQDLASSFTMAPTRSTIFCVVRWQTFYRSGFLHIQQQQQLWCLSRAPYNEDGWMKESIREVLGGMEVKQKKELRDGERRERKWEIGGKRGREKAENERWVVGEMVQEALIAPSSHGFITILCAV